MIWLSALNTVNLKNSHITADGGSAANSLDSQGSGGGSGGSIQIITRNLKGTGDISAKGGDGSEGGGGGAGGRLFMNFLKGYSAKAQPDQSHFWFGTHSLSGGQAGVYTRSYEQNYL